MTCSTQVLRVAVAFTFALVFCGSALCQSRDWHFSEATSGVQTLCKRSTYAHGYLHGYEQGFHNGDLDVHMGRGERPLKQIKDYRDSGDGYRSEYGDKKFFREGFQKGFREGYADAIHGREFRAVYETRKVAEGVGDGPSQKHDADFDRGFSAGYDMGRDTAVNGPAKGSGNDYAMNLCESKMPRSEAKHQGVYCDAFVRGYGLGFSDGVANLPTRTQTARK